MSTQLLAAQVVTSLTAWLAVVGTCLTVLAIVTRVAHKVIRFVDDQQDRNAEFDVLRADWASRGITPAGAVTEAQHYRDATDANTSAIAGHKVRLDEYDEQLGQIDVWRAVIGARVGELEAHRGPSR